MRGHCHLQTICFSKDVSLKNVCERSSWVKHHYHPLSTSTTTVRTPPPIYFRSLHTLKKQTTFLQTTEVWSTSSSTDVCGCGPQTADILPLKKQTAPNS
ncbi:hypothetical protein Hanom_Chr10g00950511 [Helianthus anomalus]